MSLVWSSSILWQMFHSFPVVFQHKGSQGMLNYLSKQSTLSLKLDISTVQINFMSCHQMLWYFQSFLALHGKGSTKLYQIRKQTLSRSSRRMDMSVSHSFLLKLRKIWQGKQDKSPIKARTSFTMPRRLQLRFQPLNQSLYGGQSKHSKQSQVPQYQRL